MKKVFKLFIGFFVMLAATSLLAVDIEVENLIVMIMIITLISALFAMAGFSVPSRKD